VATLPEEIKDVLNKGPKYSFEPSTSRPKLLAMRRRVANSAGEQNRERAIGDVVDCVKESLSRRLKAKPPFKKVGNFFKLNELALVQADKGGGFGVMSKGQFQEKALTAIDKSFKEVKFGPKSKKNLRL
ncbi:hypothetical protein HPB47_015538, partial [Ixodes persulcatus]